MRLIHEPDTLREQVEQQVRAARESKPWVRDAREAAAARERLAKLETVADNYRDQQAEGLVTMAALRDKLDGLAGERERLEARLEALSDGEARVRQLEDLPKLVEEYLTDLHHLLGREPVVREYERVHDGPPLEPRTVTPNDFRHLDEEELEEKRLESEAKRGAMFREIYVMIGLQAAVHPNGALDITVGGANTRTGVMPWDESG